jgi:hypothetical protein
VCDGTRRHERVVKARPSVRRRFNDAVLEAVYIKDRRIGRTEFSEVFAPLFSRPSSNKRLKVVLIDRCANRQGFAGPEFGLPGR